MACELYVRFLRFFKIQKHDFLRFFELLHTFSRTLDVRVLMCADRRAATKTSRSKASSTRSTRSPLTLEVAAAALEWAMIVNFRGSAASRQPPRSPPPPPPPPSPGLLRY